MEKSERFIEQEARDLARRIAKERIAPTAGDRDKNGAFPREALEALEDVGLLGMIVSERHDEANASRAAFAMLATELARACASTSLVTVSHIITEKAIETAATDRVKDNWLSQMTVGRALGAFAVHESNSGSNAGAITTTATKEDNEYIVNGSKYTYNLKGGDCDVSTNQNSNIQCIGWMHLRLLRVWMRSGIPPVLLFSRGTRAPRELPGSVEEGTIRCRGTY